MIDIDIVRRPPSLMKWRFILCPLALTREKLVGGRQYVGYCVLRVFGLRLIVWQSTSPW